MSELSKSVIFLRDLVAIPSVSGNERAAVERFIAEAKILGMDVEIDEVGNGHAMRRVTGTRGDAAPEIVLLGHIDTVPGDIAVRIEDGVLHGRGSVDAKGPLAAMLYGAATATISGASVRVVAAVGEETPHSLGARRVAKMLRPAACIIGEPSGWDGVTLGYKGRLVLHAGVSCACGHSAGPHGSAADAMIAAWQKILNVVETLNMGRKGAFETIQASVRALSSDSDGLHDTALLSAGFRLPRWISASELEAHLRDVFTGSNLALHFEGHEQAIASDRNDAVVRALSQAIRAEGGVPKPKLKTGTADMNVVGPVWQCPIAAYGPGNSSLDHTPNEHLILAEYERAIVVLASALRHLDAEFSVAQQSAVVAG